MPIHEEIAALVERAGLTRSEFARQLNVGAPQISNWLNGRVEIPAHRLDAMQKLLARLLDEPAIAARSIRDDADLGTDREADWRFVHANVNAGKDFGNAGIYATPQSIPSLVRETGQNSLDAAVGTSVTMRYTLFELTPGTRRYDRFLSAMRFEDALMPHVEGASESGGANKIGVRLKAALRAVAEGKVLRVLRIEDFGGRGLSGDEHDSEKPFSALVRDNLNSRKLLATAGGVFGIGSKTLWACSRLSTVFFSTIIHDEESSDERVRVIGKADLAYHEDDEGNAFAGAGWYGSPTGTDGASSLWLEPESDFLEDLLLSRTPPEGETRYSGTTALILAFHDPKADDDDGEGIVKRFASSLAENFWPAMIAEQLVAHVAHVVDDEGEPRTSVLVNPDDYVPALADAFRKHRSGDLAEQLVNPGDVVSVPVQFSVPATRPEGGITPPHGAVDAECRLVIRLSDPATATDKWVDHVAFARGRAMVVKYERRSGVAVGARPFHAVLLAGTLAGPGVTQRIAEQFLRFAEPTAHDDWSLNGDLKERYAYGAGARIREMYAAVIKALQKYVKTESSTSSEGPAVLKELFSLRVASPGARTAKWSLRNVTAKPMADGWDVSGEVIVDRPIRAYSVRPKVSFDPESGLGLPLEWQTLSSQDATVEDQVLRVPAGTRKVRFSGRTTSDSSIASARCVLRLDAQVVMAAAEENS